MKAIEKDPAHRYSSSKEFAEDIRRFLDGEAILAHPISFSRKVYKKAKRHKVMAVATAILLVASYFLYAFYQDSKKAQQISQQAKQDRAKTKSQLNQSKANLQKAEKNLQKVSEQNRKLLTIYQRIAKARRHFYENKFDIAIEILEKIKDECEILEKENNLDEDLDMSAKLLLAEVYLGKLNKQNSEQSKRIPEADKVIDLIIDNILGASRSYGKVNPDIAHEIIKVVQRRERDQYYEEVLDMAKYWSTKNTRWKQAFIRNYGILLYRGEKYNQAIRHLK